MIGLIGIEEIAQRKYKIKKEYNQGWKLRVILTFREQIEEESIVKEMKKI